MASACSSSEGGLLGDTGAPPVDGGGTTPDGGAEVDGALPAGDSGPLPDGQAALSADTVDLGRVVVGSSATASLWIANPGATPATVTIAPLTGRDAGRFSIELPVNEGGRFVLTAGASAEVRISVTPDAEGGLLASLPVLLCEGGCPAAVSIVAEALLTGVRCDARADFGTTLPGTCTSRQITCENIANNPEELTGIVVGTDRAAIFVLDPPPVLPIALPPGARTPIDLSFCPTELGEVTGTLDVETADPAITAKVELFGRGGGADLSCAPAEVDFGVFGVGVEVRRSVLCTNLGPERGTISALSVSPSEFAVLTGIAALDPGESIEVELALNAVATGALTGELIIESDDPVEPSLLITLRGEAVDVGPCEAHLLPSTRDFGLTPIGAVRRSALLLVNDGAAQCLLDRAVLTGDATGSYTLVTAVAPGLALDPGSALELEVELAARTTGTSSASLEVSFTNPSSTPASALLLGAAGSIDVAFDPTGVDFGATPFGCDAGSVRVIELRGVSPAPAVITAIELDQSPSAFSIAGAPALPLSLELGETLELEVAFEPTTVGLDGAELRVTVDGAVYPYVVPLAGRGEPTAARTETFQVGGRDLDLLFVIDDSASMDEAQLAFQGSLLALLQAIATRGGSVQAGVITSDMLDPARSGRLTGTPAILDALAPDFAPELTARVLTGTEGDGNAESPIAAVLAALSEPLSLAENAGLSRPGVELAVVVLTDEDDHSGGDVESHLEQLRLAIGGRRLSFYGITGPRSGGCVGDLGFIPAAPRLHELAARADRGAILSLCDPMDEIVAALAEDLFPSPRASLSVEPRPETIQVLAQGVVIPPSDASGELWRYSFPSRSIVFTPAGAPANGPIVSINYDAYCLSPTCGDGLVDTFEPCDDGNVSDEDACVAGCRVNLCGDGLQHSGVESCDDGNEDDTDGCLTGCVPASCGDGRLYAGVESCDDGNSIDGDGCPASCAYSNSIGAYYTSSGLLGATYTGLANGTALVFTGGDDDGVALLALPFPFELFGQPVVSLEVSPNGFLSTGGLAGLTAHVNSTFPDQELPSGIITPWWDDLLIDAGVSGGATVAFEVTGVSPDRELVVEWRNLRLASHSTGNHRRFSFEVALRETTGVVELRFGETQTTGNPPTATTASAGIENQDGTVGEALLSCTPSCAGPARPGNPNGFPRASRITLTPL